MVFTKFIGSNDSCLHCENTKNDHGLVPSVQLLGVIKNSKILVDETEFFNS